VLAIGGHFKSTVCVTRDDEAFVSQHVGDLDNAPTCRALDEAVAHLTAILQVEPAVIAPRPASRLLFDAARCTPRRASRARLHAVQHHHAHVAAVLAEHGVRGPVARSGDGRRRASGSDGSAWGGELLRVDGASFARLGPLRPLRLPGGDRAAREPWRMASAGLALLGRAHEVPRRFADEPRGGDRGRDARARTARTETSSLGRWFDAASVARRAAPDGVRRPGGDAARRPRRAPRRRRADRTLYRIAPTTSSTCAAAARLADGLDVAFGAALFHATLAEAIAEWTASAAQREGLVAVACGGGCFLNALLARTLGRALHARGIAMLQARAVPPNDGGIALGQAWVALQAQVAN
jgi:hydrogenase maturation protein HypF